MCASKHTYILTRSPSSHSLSNVQAMRVLSERPPDEKRKKGKKPKKGADDDGKGLWEHRMLGKLQRLMRMSGASLKACYAFLSFITKTRGKEESKAKISSDSKCLPSSPFMQTPRTAHFVFCLQDCATACLCDRVVPGCGARVVWQEQRELSSQILPQEQECVSSPLSLAIILLLTLFMAHPQRVTSSSSCPTSWAQLPPPLLPMTMLTTPHNNKKRKKKRRMRRKARKAARVKNITTSTSTTTSTTNTTITATSEQL